MSLATVRSVISRFLEQDASGVLALKGQWGVGKTYFWNQIAAEKKDRIKPANYCYVSLFGISSLPELRAAIVANTTPVNEIGRTDDAAKKAKWWANLNTQKALFFLKNLSDLPYAKSISVTLDSLIPHLINKTIICLDDFERLNDNNIKPEDLLGYISSLKEEKGCKIVLIFNEDELKNRKDAYNTYREKVIDIELLYGPTATEATEIAFDASWPHRDLAKNRAVSLNIRNIRILRKIVQIIEQVDKEIGNLESKAKIMEVAIASIVLFAWAYYAKCPDKPDLEFVLKWTPFAEWADKENYATHPKWHDQIRAYGFTSIDEFDIAIANVIKNGYVEESGLLTEAQKLDTNFKNGETKEPFNETWNKFRNTFADNEQELCDELIENTKNAAHLLSIGELDATVNLLRKLNKNDQANSLIDEFIKRRKDEKDLFDLARYYFPIEDSELKSRFDNFNLQSRQLPSLFEVVYGLSQKNGWSQIDEEVMSNSTEDDFYLLFKQEHGDNLRGIVKACLDFPSRSNSTALPNPVRSALERIAKENPLNALRVKVFKS